jgi:hypothetical protein
MEGSNRCPKAARVPPAERARKRLRERLTQACQVSLDAAAARLIA